ncbi:MAG: nucleoside-diphosphate sugar epimerase [Planctomycetes bacterium RBG_16_64_12]|nr:MAG: nucleoside-diphosphate sugar epimerase [Planctomycetes bacterium RBG_16_64_12]
MRYLVTGGAGFIGSHLVEALLEGEHEVLVLDDFSTGRHENIAHLEPCDRLEVICASVTDTDLVRDCVPSVDGVFHLASAVGVRLIIDEPVKTIETNVEGTASVLAACARYRKPVLITSTSEVYGKLDKAPFSEEDDSVIGPPTFRRWGYAASKALDEFLALAHWHQSRLPVVIVRLFNTVGPRQTGRYGMVVPRFVRQALLGEPITVYGDGEQTRCFCHVRDAVWALVRLFATRESRGEVFNVGSGEEISIHALAATIRSMTGSRSEIRRVPYAQAFGSSAFEDMVRRVPDLAKVRRLIGYQPKHSLEDTLRDVIRSVRRELETDEKAGVIK